MLQTQKENFNHVFSTVSQKNINLSILQDLKEKVISLKRLKEEKDNYESSFNEKIFFYTFITIFIGSAFINSLFFKSWGNFLWSSLGMASLFSIAVVLPITLIVESHFKHKIYSFFKKYRNIKQNLLQNNKDLENLLEKTQVQKTLIGYLHNSVELLTETSILNNNYGAKLQCVKEDLHSLIDYLSQNDYISAKNLLICNIDDWEDCNNDFMDNIQKNTQQLQYLKSINMADLIDNKESNTIQDIDLKNIL